MKEDGINFYSKSCIKLYNLNESVRHQLSLLDEQDANTRQHSENVANLSYRICQYLGMNEEFIVYCTICAYLHDIGKVYIPIDILTKKGKLNEEEYEIYKKHVINGYNMCMNDPELKKYAKAVKYHHETLQGTGYPDGIRGKDIPLESQIIKVANEFDNIVTKNKQKTHKGISQVLKIIARNTKPIKKRAENGKLIKIDKYGKNNSKIVKALIKVIINDTEYEISTKMTYLEQIAKDIKRLKSVYKYYDKYNKAKKQEFKQYYYDYIKCMLIGKETVENFQVILSEYKDTYTIRKLNCNDLYKEINKINKIKV